MHTDSPTKACVLHLHLGASDRVPTRTGFRKKRNLLPKASRGRTTKLGAEQGCSWTSRVTHPRTLDFIKFITHCGLCVSGLYFSISLCAGFSRKSCAEPNVGKKTFIHVRETGYTFPDPSHKTRTNPEGRHSLLPGGFALTCAL